MADLAITAAEVKPGANAKTREYLAGEAITVGQTVYLDPADNRVKLAAATSEAAARAIGFAMNDANAKDAPVVVQVAGKLIRGTTAPPVAGMPYALSGSGAIAGHTATDEPASGEWVTIMGIGDGVDTLDMGDGPMIGPAAVP